MYVRSLFNNVNNHNISCTNERRPGGNLHAEISIEQGGSCSQLYEVWQICVLRCVLLAGGCVPRAEKRVKHPKIKCAPFHITTLRDWCLL